MARLLRRRPSAATVIALLALFVALGGPAEAAHLLNGKLLRKGSVTGRAIKDRSLSTHDLSKKAVRRLETTPPSSVTELELAGGAVTPGKLAPGAVGPAALAAGAVGPSNLQLGSVGSGAIADGSLSTADIARYSGRFSVDVPPVQGGQCWSREPVLAPLTGANITGDVVTVTPDGSWPRVMAGGQEHALSLTVYNSARPDRFVLSLCNPGPSTVTLPATTTRVGFAYAVLAVP